MINLEASGILARYFVWSCDHLPLTVGSYKVEADGKTTEHYRTGTHYVEHGTTLCHIFWAILWVPLFGAAFASFFLFIIGAMHVLSHNDFMRSHPDAGSVVDVAAYFFPEVACLASALLVGCIILAIIGGSKVGFFTLLWQYLKGIKQRICPLVRFGGAIVSSPSGSER